jgi:hypothetical protein
VFGGTTAAGGDGGSATGTSTTTAAGTPGDANHDGTVNFSDLLILAQHYGSTNAVWETGDFSNDGAVGFGDLLTLAQHYRIYARQFSGGCIEPERPSRCRTNLCGGAGAGLDCLGVFRGGTAASQTEARSKSVNRSLQF